MVAKYQQETLRLRVFCRCGMQSLGARITPLKGMRLLCTLCVLITKRAFRYLYKKSLSSALKGRSEDICLYSNSQSNRILWLLVISLSSPLLSMEKSRRGCMISWDLEWTTMLLAIGVQQWRTAPTEQGRCLILLPCLPRTFSLWVTCEVSAALTSND